MNSIDDDLCAVHINETKRNKKKNKRGDKHDRKHFA